MPDSTAGKRDRICSTIRFDNTALQVKALFRPSSLFVQFANVAALTRLPSSECAFAISAYAYWRSTSGDSVSVPKTALEEYLVNSAARHSSVLPFSPSLAEAKPYAPSSSS